MTTNAEKFSVMLEDQTFKAAFKAADAAGRQQLLDTAGLHLSLAEAEAIFNSPADELSPADMEGIAGGGLGIILPPPGGED